MAALLLFPCFASGGPLAEAVAGGLRGVDWGNRCTPDSIIAGGKWSRAGSIRYYTVRDSRPVFGVQRKAGNELFFACAPDHSSITSMGISFPSSSDTYGELVAALQGFFGDPSSQTMPSDSPADTMAALATLTWSDGDYSMRLVRSIVGFSATTSVSITKAPTSLAKEKTGLE